MSAQRAAPVASMVDLRAGRDLRVLRADALRVQFDKKLIAFRYPTLGRRSP